MKTLNKKQNKLGAYLTAGLGAGCLAGNADAATVQIYGAGVAPPAGISFGFWGPPGTRAIDNDGAMNTSNFLGAESGYFTRGEDMISQFWGIAGRYISYYTNLVYGAVLGNANYASISFDGNNAVFEAVGQFYLDGIGGGYLIALAKNDDGSALSISAGKTAIDAVPEPSSLGLLALGAAGLLARRRRAA